MQIKIETERQQQKEKKKSYVPPAGHQEKIARFKIGKAFKS